MDGAHSSAEAAARLQSQSPTPPAAPTALAQGTMDSNSAAQNHTSAPPGLVHNILQSTPGVQQQPQQGLAAIATTNTATVAATALPSYGGTAASPIPPPIPTPTWPTPAGANLAAIVTAGAPVAVAAPSAPVADGAQETLRDTGDEAARTGAGLAAPEQVPQHPGQQQPLVNSAPPSGQAEAGAGAMGGAVAAGQAGQPEAGVGVAVQAPTSSAEPAVPAATATAGEVLRVRSEPGAVGESAAETGTTTTTTAVVPAAPAAAGAAGAGAGAGAAAAAAEGDAVEGGEGGSRKRQRILTDAEVKRREREVQLKDFLLAVNEYAPTVPVEATRFHLQRGGLATSNNQLVTLMSLAADHLVANIVHDCSRYRELRLQRPGERLRENGMMADEEEQMLTNEDLAMSLRSRGVRVSDGGALLKSAGPVATAAAAAAAAAAASLEDGVG